LKYLFIFNTKAKRYSQDAEAMILQQASKILHGAEIATVYTIPQGDRRKDRYTVQDFEEQSRNADCIVAVGGDGAINIVTNALMQSGQNSRLPLGVIPYGTGNNLVRSYGLERDSEKALLTIQQGYTINLDIGSVNQQYYFINASFGFFPYLIIRRVTNSLVGWTYDTLRHIGFTPWPTRIRYTDAHDRVIELPSQRYIVGAMLNTSHYGSFLHMAPDAIGDDGLFDIKLIREAPVFAYPFLFTVMLTGNYDLARNTTTFRARRVEVSPDATCHFETDGDTIPLQSRYTVEMAGRIRLIVPEPH
jgi:YegS/Rv2252/BmrU family lipid kinase